MISNTRVQNRLLATLGWTAIGVLMLYFDSVPLLAVSGLALSIFFFLVPLDSPIRATNTLAFSVGLFGFLPPIFYTFSPDFQAEAPEGMLAGTAWIYFTAVVLLTWGIRDQPTDGGLPLTHDPIAISEHSIRRLRRTYGAIGTLLLSYGIVLPVLGYAHIAGYLGVMLIAASQPPLTARASSWWSALLIGTAFLLYTEFVFSGFGRLILGALAFTLIMIHGRSANQRLLKIVLIALTVPILTYLAARRSDFASARNPYEVVPETGFESVVSPFKRFCELLLMTSSGQIELSMGRTFLEVLALPIPRAWWPEKPIGLGAELTLLFSPELFDRGHTILALLHGEMVFNFGLLGLVIMVPPLLFFLRSVDEALARSDHERVLTWRTLVLVLLASGLPDLIWGGTLTYATRAGLRVGLLAVIWSLWAVISSHRLGRDIDLPNRRRRTGG